MVAPPFVNICVRVSNAWSVSSFKRQLLELFRELSHSVLGVYAFGFQNSSKGRPCSENALQPGFRQDIRTSGNQDKMIWAFKRPRWSAATKSKIFLSIVCFSMGYLSQLLVPLHNGDDGITSNKELSSRLGESKDSGVLLVILIFSSVNNFNRRDTLRETWLSGFSDSAEVKYYFVISAGNAKENQRDLISVEQNKYNDLLIFPNLEDSFYLLTPKLLASFGWLTSISVLGEEGKSETEKPFQSFKFVLKCDDDVFVRLTDVVKELGTTFSGEKAKNLYWGFFDGRARVKKSGKYKEDQWDICDYYIPYALGGGYVLARPLVEFIARNGDFMKKYKNEDVSVGAWLGSFLGINRVHDPRFDTEYISRGCHQSYLITHKHSEIAIRNFYNNIKKTGHLCLKEYKTRMSYVYNWQVVPSKCCDRINPNIP